MRRLLTVLSLTALLIGLVTVAGLSPAAAGVTITVQSFRDATQASSNGKCSLRAAVSAANSNMANLFCGHNETSGTDTIMLKAGTYTLEDDGNDDDNELGDLDVDGDLVIRGAGADRTTIDASDLSPSGRLFDILSGTVTLRDLTLRGGDAAGANGGAIWNLSSLTLNRVTVHNNDGLNGGGVYHGSTATELDIRNSTFSSNAADFSGGGIWINGPGATLTNVTVSGNDAEDNGGGVGIQAAGGAELHSVTVVDNEADLDDDGGGSGGGLYANGGSDIVMENSLLARNRDQETGVTAPDCRLVSSTMTTNQNNLVANSQECDLPAGTDNVLGEPARIDDLANNGGPTRTHALKASSPAIDEGSGCPGADQRGAPRNGCDIGAYQRVMCTGVLVNRVGTDGGEKLIGTAQSDGFLALGGNDIVLARAGKDGACPGSGNDVVRGDDDADKILAASGNDRIFGGAAGDSLEGESGNDLIDGDGGTDRCRGGTGADTVRDCET
jgi:hypothetical protein